MVSHYRNWELPVKMHRFFTYSPLVHHFDYKWYNFELLRLLGSAPYGGCDAAEFLETVARLRPNDEQSWQQEWLSLATRTEVLAQDALEAGHKVTARGAFLRASNYFRCAQYMFPCAPERDQPYLLSLYDRSVANFEQASKLMSHDVRRVQIPFSAAPGTLVRAPGGGLGDGDDAAGGGAPRVNGVTVPSVNLPGWLHIPAPAQRLPGRRTPVLVCFGGADSTQEELYFLSAAEGPPLGYAVLTFDAPGQGLVLRRDGVPLRPDGEAVMTAVVDFLDAYAAEHPEADLDVEGGLVVTGQSLGAYLALRGAADPRIRACVAVDPIYDLWDLAMSRMPGFIVWPWENNYVGDGLIDWVAITHSRVDVAARYMFAQAQGMLGSPSPAQLLRDMKLYSFRLHRTVVSEGGDNDNRNGHAGAGAGRACKKRPPRYYNQTGDYLERVTCPVLVTGAGADPTMFIADITVHKVMAGLVNVDEKDKELWMPQTYSEGGAQAKSGAWQMLQFKTFKFLDAKLGIRRCH